MSYKDLYGERSAGGPAVATGRLETTVAKAAMGTQTAQLRAGSTTAERDQARASLVERDSIGSPGRAEAS